MDLTTHRFVNGTRVWASVADIAVQRLKGTCFRGTHRACAGNFSKWGNALDMFDGSEDVMDQLIEDVEQAVRAETWGANSVCMKLGYMVGWTATCARGTISEDVLEPFTLGKNGKASGLRVKLDATHILAPQTDLATVIYELRSGRSSGSFQVIVWSIYPGPDVGEIQGNITERERQVFFDFNHPGQLL